MVDFDIENELRPQLRSDEKFIWTGKPKTGLAFRSSDWVLIPFSLFWGGFAIFWEITVMVIGAPFIFRIFGIPFVLVGIYMIIGRFFVDAKKRKNTLYGITSERIIIQSGIFSKQIESLNIKTLPNISYTQKADQSGTILLGPVNIGNARSQGLDWTGVRQSPKLDMIEDVKTVFDQITELQQRK